MELKLLFVAVHLVEQEEELLMVWVVLAVIIRCLACQVPVVQELLLVRS